MTTKLTSKPAYHGGNSFFKNIQRLLFSLVFLGLSFSISAQQLTECHHHQSQYYQSSSYLGFGVYNDSNLYSSWQMTIPGANYMIDADNFYNQYGLALTVTSTPDGPDTYTHVLTLEEPMYPYEYLTWVYQGSVTYTNDATISSGTWDMMCLYDESQLCEELGFNFANEDDYYWGFEVQNNASLDINTYEIYISNANYSLDLAQLDYAGYDLTVIDNGDGTYDYIFVNQSPIPAYSTGPTVSSSAGQIGEEIGSDGLTINCQLSDVSSGNEGGLESHGGLSSKIALRNFKKSVGISTDPLFKTDNTIVSNLAPKHILNGDKLVESSPTDLIAITAAETVWSGDYFINNRRYASVFGTQTENEVYDHTKVICDRVKGSELVSVDVVDINGFDAIMSIIRRPNETLEYAVSFSLAYAAYGQFTFTSQWAIDQYESSPNFLNYQVWTNSKVKTIKAAQEILQNVVAENGFELNASNLETRTPSLYATRANYKLGKFHIDLHNAITEATTVTVTGKCYDNEVNAEAMPFTQEITLNPGQTELEVAIPFGNVFDGEIELIVPNGKQKDAIYLADGSWGLEYNEENTSISKYDITPEKRTYEDNEYIVERGISVAGSTDSYISIFKQLEPGGMPVDLSAYNSLSFDCTRQGVYKVALLTSGNSDPAKNLSYTLEVEAGSEVSIPFAHFTNSSGDVLDTSDITTIYISYQSDNNKKQDFALDIENVRFKNDETANLNVYAGGLEMHPNPSNGNVRLTHKFNAESDVMITVYNTNGAIIKQFTKTAFEGIQTFDVTFDNHEQGAYLISLQTNEGIFSNTVLIVR